MSDPKVWCWNCRCADEEIAIVRLRGVMMCPTCERPGCGECMPSGALVYSLTKDRNEARQAFARCASEVGCEEVDATTGLRVPRDIETVLDVIRSMRRF